jgi:DNA-binding MurR/RpiR family transcriptional regulator
MLPDERRDVLEHIRTSYNSMSKSQKRVAEFLLTSGIDVVYLSASRIADLVDVNRSTVVRTAQALGYEGFVDLQADLQQQLLKRFSTADRVKMDLLRLSEDIEDQASGAQGMAILSSMARAEIEDLENMVSRISEADFNRAVDLLERGQKIYVLGLRGSLPLAMTFVFLLRHVRAECYLLEPGVQDLADQLVNMKSDDLLFTISYSRYANDTIRCMEYARQIGTPVITLTDSPVSPAAKRADLAFVLLFRMYLYRNTSTPMVLLNALAAALSARDSGYSQQRLERLEAVYRQLEIFRPDHD